jgi:hypothetical protein
MHATAFVILIALAFTANLPAVDHAPASKNPLPPSFASTAAFLDSVRGQVWEKVGTFQVSRVRLDAAGLDCLTYGNRYLCTHPDTSVLDPGIVRTTYRNRTASWNFYLPDGVHAITCKAEGWQLYEPLLPEEGKGAEGEPNVDNAATMQRLHTPDDIWKAQVKGNGAGAGGITIEFPFLRLTDGTVELQREITERPAVAAAWEVSDRVTEFTEPGGRVFWAAVAADGSRLWLIEVRHVFAAMLCHGPRVTAIPADAPLFLDEREQRMMDAVAQLHAAKLEREALALQRELVRRVSRTHGTGSPEHRLMLKRYPLTHPR